MDNITASKQSSGNLIKKNILSIYPGAVLYGLLFNITLMIDSIIAGWNLGPEGIAAVALGVPGYGVLAAIIYSFIHGSGLRMIWAKGRADDQEFQRAFNGGSTLIGFTGIAFAILIFVFSDNIILLCGGDMVDPSIRNSAVIYLCFCSPIVFLTALGMILQEVMNVMGFQTARAALSMINVVVNLIVSVLCVSILPTDMKLAGLGIGTSLGGLAEFIAGIILLRIMDVRLGYRPLILHPKEVLETVRCGFPAAVDYFAENIVMGIQNNLILSGFPGDTMILSTGEVVCNISYFASGTIKGAAIAAEPLFGVFYEERDVNSIKKVWKQGWLMGMVMSVVLAVLFCAAAPLLSALCGMEPTSDIQRGVIMCMIFAPFMHTVYMFTLYYEATKHFNLSMAFAIVPDSCLYVLMMAFLIPILGRDGIWLSITGNQVIGLILLIPLVLLINTRSGKNTDRMLLLPEKFYSGTTLLDLDIPGYRTGNIAEIEKISSLLRSRVSEPDKAEAVLRCVEALISDMCESSGYIHIKVREEGTETAIFIRSIGQMRKLPESIYENVIKWGGSDSISYSYVYKMNIVCITIHDR